MRTFLVNVGYGLNVVLLGLVGFTLSAEGHRVMPLVMPLLVATLVVVMAWLALRDEKNQRLGKAGRLGGYIVPGAAALAFLWMAGSASAIGGQRALVLLYVSMVLISIQTLGQIWLLRKDESAVVKTTIG